MSNSHFNGCTFGWYAENMAITSFAMQSEAQFNSNSGIYFQGSAVLNIIDPSIDNNFNGLVGKQSMMKVKCGSISYNTEAGILVKSGGTLFMDGSAITSHPSVTAI